MNTSRSYGRRISSGIALGTAGLVTAGLITAAPVHDTSPVDHSAVALAAFATPSPSMSLTSFDLQADISAAADYVPSLWLQQAYFFVGITVGAAVGTALAFVDGLPAPLRDVGRTVLQFVATAVKTTFDALFFIDKQVQGIFGGLTNPQPARATVHLQSLSSGVAAPAAAASQVPGVPARQPGATRLSARATGHAASRTAGSAASQRVSSRPAGRVTALNAAAEPVRHPGTARESRRGRG